jgi:hypothetical protein
MFAGPSSFEKLNASQRDFLIAAKEAGQLRKASEKSEESDSDCRSSVGFHSRKFGIGRPQWFHFCFLLTNHVPAAFATKIGDFRPFTLVFANFLCKVL